MRVRKNAAKLTPEEWERFNRAVIALKHTYPPGSSISVYDQFVAIHLGIVQLVFVDAGATGPAAGVDGAHGGPAFLSWHREYLRRLEIALQAIDPQVTIPYWNWGSGDVSETMALFQDNRIGPMGSGGSSGFDVMSGYYALNPNALNPMGWLIHERLRPFGEALQRNQVLDTGNGWPTATSITNMLSQGSYQLFRPALERSPHHNRIHGRMGRDMARMTSPNDPIFFLHHCQVDRLWAQWQQDHPGSANYNPMDLGGYGHRLNDRMWPWDGGQSTPGDGAGGPSVADLITTYAQTDIVTPADVLDHRALGYCYDTEPGCPCEEEPSPPTTLRFGEENPTTLALGEEGLPTTLRFGEEGPTTLAFGEEGRPTTFRVGEEGILPTTIFGEQEPFEGIDNPFGNF